MTSSAQPGAIRPLVATFLILFAVSPVMHAQTFAVLHAFTDGADGGGPGAGLTMDRAGNLYGTASGYLASIGSAFKLTKVRGNWVLNPLFDFTDNNEGTYGYEPDGTLVFGADGASYVAVGLGGSLGYGTVVKLQPHATFCASITCYWSATVLFDFDQSSGSYPDQIDFDRDGNIYGTTGEGGYLQGSCLASGLRGCGTVYQLTNSGGTWSRKVLYQFHNSDGNDPMGGVLFDSAGNLYGITRSGGTNNLGVVFKLSPAQEFWDETILHIFSGGSDGEYPGWPLTMDAAGNLYGVTQGGGSGGYGTVFELSPPGTWNLQTLYRFSAAEGVPNGGLLLDSAGNIYGTTFGNSNHTGIIFKLTLSSGSWSLTDLHDFNAPTDGLQPIGGVISDAQGNLYGTAFFGGAYNYGTAWELTP